MKTKLKSYNGKINTYFYSKKSPKENSSCYCLATIEVHDECKIKNEDDKKYPYIYLEEWKYEKKKIKKNHIEKEKTVIPDIDETDDEFTE